MGEVDREKSVSRHDSRTWGHPMKLNIALFRVGKRIHHCKQEGRQVGAAWEGLVRQYLVCPNGPASTGLCQLQVQLVLDPRVGQSL